MRPSRVAWPKTDGARGVLMFAQMLQEMLSPKTFESFRAYSLNSASRLREAMSLINDVQLKRIPKAALDPVVEELHWSFSNDPAVGRIAESIRDSLLASAKKDINLTSLSAHCKLLLRLLDGTYMQTLEENISEVIADTGHRSELRKLAGFYCSLLIGIGYTREYILSITETVFFSDSHQRAGRGLLSKFFAFFDVKNHAYVVHCAVTVELGGYLRGLGLDVVEFIKLNADQCQALVKNTKRGLDLVWVMRTQNIDQYAAIDASNEVLSFLKAIGFLDPDGIRADWGAVMHVARRRASAGEAISRENILNVLPQNYGIVASSGSRQKRISRYTRSIFNNFNQESTQRLMRSIKTASLARNTTSPQSQLVSLWSGFEVLASEPDEGVARIVHYSSLIVPCITLRHARRQFNAVYDRLLLYYGAAFRRWLRKHTRHPEVNGQRAFIELMILEEFENNRVELLEMVSENPLALHRLWKLNRDYEDLKAVKKTITDHSSRVTWQLHRVYRARNLLVHAGQNPSYLESVMMNIAEYYRSALATIVSRARLDENLSDIDQTVSEIGIQCGVIMHKLTRANRRLTVFDLNLVMDYPGTEE